MSDLHLVDDENRMVINTASGLILLQLCGKIVAPVADSARIIRPYSSATEVGEQVAHTSL